MDTHDLGRQQAEFERLASLTAEARAAALEQLRKDDAQLADQVESLLKWDQAGATVSQAQQQFVQRQPQTTLNPGQSIGPFKLRRRLGAGGFGEVWLASRESPRLEVAIKILKADSVGDVHPSHLREFQLPLGIRKNLQKNTLSGEVVGLHYA